MKKIVIFIGLLILGAIGYYGYTLNKKSEVPAGGAAYMMSETMAQNEDTKSKDSAVKESIVEEIPTEEVENRIEEALIKQAYEEDVVEEEKSADSDATPDDIEKIIGEQEALIHSAAEEGVDENEILKEDEQETPLDEGAKARLADVDKMVKRDEIINQKVEDPAQIEENKILEAEEAFRKAAIEAN